MFFIYLPEQISATLGIISIPDLVKLRLISVKSQGEIENMVNSVPTGQGLKSSDAL